MRTPNHPLGCLMNTVRALVSCAPAASGRQQQHATSAAMTNEVGEASISLRCRITLEPPQGGGGGHLSSGRTRSHRRQIVLIDNRIVRRGLQRALGGMHDLVERLGARSVESGAIAGALGKIVGGDVLGSELIFANCSIECSRRVVD